MSYTVIITEETAANVVVTTQTYPITIEYNATSLTSTYGNANVAALLSAFGSNTISTTGNITAGYFLGNGSQLTGIVSTYGNANVAALLSAFGSNTISTTGNITGGNISGTHQGSGAGLSSLTGANVSGTVANATFATSAATATSATTAGTVTTAAQANITSVGVLTSLSSTGNITGANINGNGSGLSSITGGNVTGTVANATFATSAGSATTATTATSATTAGTVTTAAQPNITSVGTLTSLSVSGNVTSGNTATGALTVANDAVITGNLTVNGTTTTINSNTVTTNDLAIVLANNQSSSANIAGAGIVAGSPAVASLLYSHANTAWESNVALRATGNVTATAFVGSGQYLSAIAGANVSGTVANATYALNANASTFAGTVTTAAQPNITSVGILTSLSATGNITGNYILGNGSQLTGLPAGYSNADVATLLAAFGSNSISTTGNITGGNISGTHLGSGAGLSSLTGANVTGTVANATYAVSAGSATTAATVTDAAQPNITSVGTLSSLSVSGNITGGNILSSTFQAVNSGGGTLKNASGATQASWGAGGGDNFAVSVSTNLNGANAQIDISPTGSGHVHIKPTGTGAVEIAPTSAGSINNMVIGNVTPAAVSATTVSATGNVTAGNVTTAGQATVTGNITGGNILTGGLISATGAITGAAVTGTSLTVSTGNITAGNLLLSGAIEDSAQLDIRTTASNANIVFTPNGTGNVNMTTSLSVTGNSTVANVSMRASGANGINITSSGGNLVSNISGVQSGRIVFGDGYDGNLNHTGISTEVNTSSRLVTLDKITLPQTQTNPARVAGMAGQLSIDVAGSTWTSKRASGYRFDLQLGNGTINTPNYNNIRAAAYNIVAGNSSPSNIGNANIVTVSGVTSGMTVGDNSRIGNALTFVSIGAFGAGSNTVANSQIGYGFVGGSATAAGDNVIGFYFNGTTNRFGLPATANLARQATNYYAFMNDDPIAQMQLGSIRSAHTYTGVLTAQSGNITIDKANGQTQILGMAANVTITGYSNLVTTLNNGATSKTQTDVLTILVPPTAGTLTLPTGAAYKYLAGNSTVPNLGTSWVRITVTATDNTGTVYLTEIDEYT